MLILHSILSPCPLALLLEYISTFRAEFESCWWTSFACEPAFGGIDYLKEKPEAVRFKWRSFGAKWAKEDWIWSSRCPPGNIANIALSRAVLTFQEEIHLTDRQMHLSLQTWFSNFASYMPYWENSPGKPDERFFCISRTVATEHGPEQAESPE